MGDDRYDWTVGTRARDFDIVVGELGGVHEAKPKIMVEMLTNMGHTPTYNQVKSRLQAKRKIFAKEQEYANTTTTGNSPLSSQSGQNAWDSPFESQPPQEIFPRSMVPQHIPHIPHPPRCPRSDNGGTIFTLSGITDMDVGKVSDLLASELSKMSVEEQHKNNDNQDAKMEAKIGSDLMSEMPSVSIGKFLQESYSDPEKLMQLCQFQLSQQQNLYDQFDVSQNEMDSNYSFPKSFEKSFEKSFGQNNCQQFFQVQNFQQQNENLPPNQQNFEQYQLQLQQQQIDLQQTQQQQQLQQQQQYPWENCGPITTSGAPQPFYMQTFQNIQNEYPNGILDEYQSFGQRTIITGDPSFVERWQN